MATKKTPSKKSIPALTPVDEGDETPLDDLETLFVAEYLIDRDRVAAVRRIKMSITHAGANQLAHKLMKRPHVRREIWAAIRAQERRTKVTADGIVKELGRLAFSDPLQLVDHQTGQLQPLRLIPLELRRAIQSIKVSREKVTRKTGKKTSVEIKDTLVEYKLWDKNAALTKLLELFGLRQSIPSLEVLLSVLPPDISQQVKLLLASPQALEPNGNVTVDNSGAHVNGTENVEMTEVELPDDSPENEQSALPDNDDEL